MKKPLPVILSIPEPCSEDWENMAPNGCGRFCFSCQKTIIDFTELTDNDLCSIVQTAPEGFCGRFRQDQLDRNVLQPPHRSAISTRFPGRIAAFFLLLQAVITNVKAQKSVHKTHVTPAKHKKPGTIVIKGRLLDLETQEPLAGVQLTFCDSSNAHTQTARTGSKGNFSFEIPAHTVSGIISTDNNDWPGCYIPDETVSVSVTQNAPVILYRMKEEKLPETKIIVNRPRVVRETYVMGIPTQEIIMPVPLKRNIWRRIGFLFKKKKRY
ncbi:carboxypeptidase-like regulatory domain-containing protein [Chitinophagaceae bacterium MMS25-I14]